MVARPAVYECLADTLDARVKALSDAATGRPGEPSDRVDEADRLAADQATLRRHADLVEQSVTYGAATFCRACGEPAPCETIRQLAEQYGCDAVG